MPDPAAAPPALRRYRYYDLLMVGFVTVLLCSNLIGPMKVALLFGVSFGVGNVFFPISYIFGDVLTEVYGYAAARRVIWAGFAALAFAALMSQVIYRLPVDPAAAVNLEAQAAIETLFAPTPRIILASILAYLVGDFVNSYVMAKMKIWSAGRWLWMRTIGSTFAGQGVDSFIFYPLAFGSLWESQTLLKVIAANWAFKVGVEALMTPVTYKVCRALKTRENEDYYDQGTDFTPFRVKL